ncbi:TldD/PmbA family protein [Thermodesulfobacterium hydrogeniphilum]|uniref:TldD/PmbA family protein n=1 Tax=Thermodesulfobacterium hydrogeniphilum TaxID=161156 RepID=UPI0006896C6F|nr:metallopeptidase TldD-related protein [Thermodesulfobacterium hydrogeniphilum]
MEEIIKNLLKKEAQSVEFWIELEEGIEVEKRDGKIFLKERYNEQTFTVRYLNKNGKAGLSYNTFLNPVSIEETCLKAKVLSEHGVPTVFPKPSKYPEISPKTFHFLTFDEILNILNEVEEELFDFDSAIKRIEKLKLSCGTNKYILLRKDLKFSWEVPFYSFIISVVAKNNEKEASAYEWLEDTKLDLTEIKERAFLACKKTLALSKAKKGKSLKIPVLFPPFISVEFLDLLEFAFLGDEVLKGRSYLKDKLGKKVFSEKLTLYDDGINPDLPESRPFDDEGEAQNKKVLVEKGVVKEFLFDTFWKKEAEKRGFSNIRAGNARRPDFTTFPKVSSTNFYIEKGVLTQKELLNLNTEVFEVLEILGAHTSDPISGDFSLGVSGIYYKNGEPVDYFSEMALSGNFFELFNNIIEIGSDLKFYGSTGSPSLLINKMDIGG